MSIFCAFFFALDLGWARWLGLLWKGTSANRHGRNGPSEFFVTGTLKEWSIEEKLHNIQAKTLLINGRYDEAQDETVEPYAKLIPDVKWEKFAESSHTPLWEERERYMEVVGRFLTE